MSKEGTQHWLNRCNHYIDRFENLRTIQKEMQYETMNEIFNSADLFELVILLEDLQMVYEDALCEEMDND